MSSFILIVEDGGYDCGASIGCGTRVIKLKSKIFDDSIEEAYRGLLDPEQKFSDTSDNQFSGLELDVLETCEVYEISKTHKFAVDDLREAQIIEIKKFAEKQKIKEEKELLKKLREKYPDV